MPTLFLSYANENKAAARKICEVLENSPNVRVWMDKQSLQGGTRWEQEITRKISEADYFVPLLSRAFLDKSRFAFRELELAIEIQRREPERRFIVPTRIEACEFGFPELEQLHCIDLFESGNRSLHQLLSAVGRYGEYTGDPEIRLTSHQAVFRVSERTFFYFINVCNLMDRAIAITHVHYQDPTHHISITPRSRPLPVKLEAADVWCTFIRKGHLPLEFSEDAFDKFFVRLVNGHVYRSKKEDSIMNEGSVPGGAIMMEDVVD